VDEPMAKASGLSQVTGVIVQELTEGGAGTDAGIKEGDIILSINGREVNSANTLQAYVAQKHPGDVVTLNIWRDKKSVEMKVKLRERKEDAEKFASKEDEEGDDSSLKDTEKVQSKSFEAVGLTVRNLNSDLKEQYKVDYGVLITDVKKFAKAADQGLRRNDVILEADRRKIKNVSDFAEVMQSKKTGDAIMLRIKTRDAAGTGYLLQFRAVEVGKEK
jgi:serine protease Do